MSGVVIRDRILSGYNGNLEHMVHTADLDNGSFVHVGSLKTGERELKNAVVPTTATLMQEVVLVHSPELLYDTTYGRELSRFTNKAGKAFRAFHLAVGDIISISDDMFSGATVLDQYVIPQNNSVKLAPSATDPGTTRFVAKVIEKYVWGVNAIPMTAIQVIKA